MGDIYFRVENGHGMELRFGYDINDESMTYWVQCHTCDPVGLFLMEAHSAKEATKKALEHSLDKPGTTEV